MKKLSIICVLALVLGLMSTAAYALSFKFDFYDGNSCYPQGDFEDPQEIRLWESATFMVDIWLVDWPQERENIVAIDYHFQWDTDSLDVVSVTCNNLKPTGQWDAEFHHVDIGDYLLGMAVFGGSIPGPHPILLHTVELHCKASSSTAWIKATLGSDGVVVDVYGMTYFDVEDGNGTIIINGPDIDGDGISNLEDNCPCVFNPNQADEGDGDGFGDACDNCPETPNGPNLGTCYSWSAMESGMTCKMDSDCAIDEFCSINQEDKDSDGLGNVCDNCPDNYNPGQEDEDQDGDGDVCDSCTDTDGDGYGNPGFPNITCDEDNCPEHPNGSLLGICVKECGGVIASYRVGDPPSFINCESNNDCIATGGICEKYQWDINGNGCGDVCECYMDCNNSGSGDSKVTGADLMVFKQEYGRFDCDDPDPCYADGNEDSKVTGADLTLFKNEYGRFDCPECP